MTADARTVPVLTLPITTRRLSLRNYTEADAATVAAYVGVAAYWENQAVDLPTTAQISALVTWAAAEAKVAPRLNYFLAATKRDSGEIVGEAVLRLINPTAGPAAGQAEIGFGIAAKFWRQGFATEIGRALLDAAFGALKTHRVVAQCAPENVGSIRVMQKLGLAREGVMRDVAYARGRWWSTTVYSMLDAEYATARGRGS